MNTNETEPRPIQTDSTLLSTKADDPTHKPRIAVLPQITGLSIGVLSDGSSYSSVQNILNKPPKRRFIGEYSVDAK